MGKLKTTGILIAIAAIGLCVVERSTGQDKPDNTNSAKTAKERQKLEFWKERKADRARDSALKAHIKHQTKAVRKRMKKDAKKAKEYNNSGA